MSRIEQASIVKLQPARWLATFSRYLLYLIGLFVLVSCYMEYRRVGWLWSAWDLMYISGLVAFIIALYFARTIPFRMSQTLLRLTNRGAFVLPPQSLDSFRSRLNSRAQLFAVVSAIFVGLALLVAFLFAYREDIIQKLTLTILETCLGLVAGYYIGQMIGYGTMGLLAKSEKVPIITRPGHIDRAAGLKPIGDFYFFQAMVVAIPCIFLAVWWFIIPFLTPWYSHWRNPYLGLLIIALTFEILSFIVPMWVFHLIMREQKIENLAKADDLSQKIDDLETKILAASDTQPNKELQQQLEFYRAKYWEIEQMPTWPVDINTRRRFTINNLLLFMPFILDLISASKSWKDFLDTLVTFLTKD